MSFLLSTNRKSLVSFQNMGSDLKFGAPSGEMDMTSLPVIEKRPISPKPLQIGVSFLLTTNRKSLLGFQNMRSDIKFGAPYRRNRHDVTSGYRNRSITKII